MSEEKLGVLSLGALPRSSDEVVASLTETLEQGGLHVYRSFDLRTARSAGGGCTCPHHGTAECDCQMVVLLIYGPEAQPSTLVLHGHDQHTWIESMETTSSEVRRAVATLFGPAALEDGEV